MAFGFGMLTEYSIFYTKLPKQAWFFLVAWIATGIAAGWFFVGIGIGWLQVPPSFLDDLWQIVLSLGSMIEILRITLTAIIRKKEGAWTIGIGLVSAIFSIVVSGGWMTALGLGAAVILEHVGRSV